MSQPLWFIGLYDAAGQLLSDLGIASNVTLTYQMNHATVVGFDVPLTHEAAGQLAIGSTYVKAYRQVNGTRTLKFYGPVWVDEITPGGVDMVRVTALDPMVYLTKRNTSATYTATDRGSIIKGIIDTTNTANDTGILTSASWIEASSTVTLDFAEQQPRIADVITQLADALDGCDTAIIPMEISSGKIGELHCYAGRGSAQPAAIFGYGPNTTNNCASITRIRNGDLLANDVIGQGDGLTPTEKTDATSQAAIRMLTETVSFTGETNDTSLSAATQTYLDTHATAAAIAEYRVTPGPRAPRLFDSFDIGDTITLWFDYGNVAFRTQQRVRSCTISVDDVGREIITAVETRSL